MLLAQIGLAILGVYLALGVLFGIAFVIAGVQRLDHGAAGCGFGFRLLILPGTAALWPLMLTRWLHVSRRTS